MGLNIELYFRAPDLREISNRPTVSSILVIVDTVQSETGPVVIAKATAFNDAGDPVGSDIPGCPTPCHPGGDPACLGTSDQLLQSYIDKGFFL